MHAGARGPAPSEPVIGEEALDEIVHLGRLLDLHQVASVWQHGSVVRSWLLDLLETALAEDPGLATVTGYVDDSGEGRWTVQEAIARGVPATAIAHSLFARFASRQDDSFGMQVIAALRKGFGGHAVRSR